MHEREIRRERAQPRHQMKDVPGCAPIGKRNLEDVRNGVFAREYLLEMQVGRPVFNSARKAIAEHPIEQVGERLRSMMPWLKKKE